MFNRQQLINSLSHGTRRVPWLTLILAGLTIVFYFAGPGVFDILIYEKTAIRQGQIWRCLSGHFVHCNFEHLFWDLVGLIILTVMIERHDQRQVIPALLMSCLGVSLWLYWGDSPFQNYCGLSGALNGLLVVAASLYYRVTKNKIYILAIVLTVIKMIFEFTTHQTIFTDLASQSVPGAHAAGFITGFIYIYLHKVGSRRLAVHVDLSETASP